MQKINELLPFKDLPDHIMATNQSFDGFTRIYAYNTKPFDFGIFITRKDTDNRQFTVEYMLNVEGNTEREERGIQTFKNSTEVVEFINYKFNMMWQWGF